MAGALARAQALESRADRAPHPRYARTAIVAAVLHPPSLLSSRAVPSHRPPPCPTAPPRPSPHAARAKVAKFHAVLLSASAPPRETKCPFPASKCQNQREICEAKRHTADTRCPRAQSCGRRSRADAFATQPAPRPARTDLERTTTHTNQAAFAKYPRDPITAQIRALRRCELRTLHSLCSAEGKAPASGRVPPPGRVTDCSAQGFALAVDIYCHSFLAGRAADD